MSDWRQQPKPHVKGTERGRLFAPEYDTELTYFDVKPAEWTHLCSARFGDGRPCGTGNTKWTGNSYRYDIFFKTQAGENDLLALRWSNGSGDGWLISEWKKPRRESNILDVITTIGDEGERWDLCHFLWQTAHKTALAAERATAARYERAFMENRLKKKKGPGGYRVRIEDLA